jgi:hypothetical protein
MYAFGRSRRHHQIPSSLQDSAGPERLPELNVEFTSGRSAAHQAFHHHAFRHYFIMTRNRGTADTLAGRARFAAICGLEFERGEGGIHAIEAPLDVR